MIGCPGKMPESQRRSGRFAVTEARGRAWDGVTARFYATKLSRRRLARQVHEAWMRFRISIEELRKEANAMSTLIPFQVNAMLVACDRLRPEQHAAFVQLALGWLRKRGVDEPTLSAIEEQVHGALHLGASPAGA